MWADFHESKQQRDQQKQQVAMDSAGRAREQAGAVQREREAERAAERSSREQGGGVDMLDQSNVMASFQVCPLCPHLCLAALSSGPAYEYHLYLQDEDFCQYGGMQGVAAT